ncbi:MAG: succinyl-CoA synthetase subunit alpha [Deltaproteobacteria bacterium]|nr:succinyl-CoA synthetase subunit alpha [Deltaproteobacteria bacterium]
MTNNYGAYAKLDKSGLENKYVVIVDGKVVAKGEDIENMLAKVRGRYPKKTPFVAKVPDDRMMIL